MTIGQRSAAMDFFHADGLPAAWSQAMKFAGQGGRLATMPDIVAARLASQPEEKPWEKYYTTLTAEYYGLSKSGQVLLIIAHGVGPMSTLEGIKKAYSWHYQDKSRNRRGGRITQQEFWDLAEGKYGPVEIVDFENYCKRYRYPFMEILRASQALTDPVLEARLGAQSEEYILAHAEHARKWHRQQADYDPENKYNRSALDHELYLNRRESQHSYDGAEDSDPHIIKVGDASNCSYYGSLDDCRIPEKGYALAHLISTSSLWHTSHDGKESLTLEISCHEWWNGVRLVGIKSNGNVELGINSGPDAYRLLRENWQDLLVPVDDVENVGFRGLVQVGEQWFTQYPKQGERMDTWEPEYLVTSIEPVGDPALFRTTVGGYHGFFKFGVSELEAISPLQANAYSFVSDPEIEWDDEGSPTHHTAMVQFFRVEVDTSKRLIRSDQLSHDYDTMMKLMQKNLVA